MFNFGTGLSRFDLVTYNSNTVDLSSIYTDIDALNDKDSMFTTSISSLELLTNDLLTGYSNNSNLIASISTSGSEGSSNYDYEIALLKNKDITFTSQISTLQSKDANLDLNVSNLNSGISNLSILSSNYAFQYQIASLNSGISNLSVVSSNSANQAQVNAISASVSNLSVATSNYVTITDVQTITNKTFNFADNTFLGFSSAGSYDADILALENADIAIMNDISSLEVKDVNLDLDIASLNMGYSNQLLLISNNANSISSLNTTVTFLNLDINSLNTGYSNQLTSINTNTSAISALSAKEIGDVANLNTASSNQLTSINTNTSAISSLSSGYSNNSNVISSLSVSSSNYVTLTGIQTLTNKTMTATTNNITANSLRSATTNIDISTATAPSSNQVLTAISSTSAIWSTPSSGSGGGGSLPSGTVIDYAGSTAPTNWLLCYGQEISRTTYSALFAIISTIYGVGDGSTTFNLPDLRGRTIAGKDDMGGASANRLTGLSGGLNGNILGTSGGAETHTLTIAQIPAHTHTYTYGSQTGVQPYRLSTNGGTTTDVPSSSTGGNAPHNNVQPTFILNKIIKT